MPAELKPCGTYAAFRRHQRRGEPIDDACREARNARMSEYRSTSGTYAAYVRARTRALWELRRRHPEEFDALFAEERAQTEGATP